MGYKKSTDAPLKYLNKQILQIMSHPKAINYALYIRSQTIDISYHLLIMLYRSKTKTIKRYLNTKELWSYFVAT